MNGMKSTSPWRALIICAASVIVTGFASTAHAGVLIDTLPGTTGSRTLNSGSLTSSESFTGAQQLEDAALEVKVAGTVGSMVLSLWTDVGGGLNGQGVQPATDLGTIATISELAIKNAIGATNTEGLIYITNINNLGFATGLSSTATYWLQVGVSGTRPSNLSTLTGITDAVGVTSYFTSTLVASPPFMQACISANGSCAAEIATDGLTIAGTFNTPVPEPGSLAIFGTALAGCGLLRRRSRVGAGQGAV
jgi:hypothetical protein